MTDTTGAVLFLLLLVAALHGGRAIMRHIRDWRGVQGSVDKRLRAMGEGVDER